MSQLASRCDFSDARAMPRSLVLLLCSTMTALGCSREPNADDASETMSNESSETDTGAEQIMCGGPDALVCPAGSYCDDKACELTGALAPCLPIPSECEAGVRQVCGCDGELHDSPCAAIQATEQSWCYDGEACGFDISQQIVCETPPGTFACGNVYCDVASEFCDRWVCLAGTQVSRCAPLPGTCPSPADCACVEATKEFGDCSVTPEGGIVYEYSEGPDACSEPPVD